jgi:hypothetical protein
VEKIGLTCIMITLSWACKDQGVTYALIHL